MANQGTVTALARRMLQDSGATRWTESDLNAYVAEAVRRAFAVRPDLWVSPSGVMPAYESVSSSVSSVPDEAQEALAHYVVFLALSEDDADRGNAQTAAEHLAMFGRILRGF